MSGAGAHAVVPGGEHHVLGAATRVEGVRAHLDDDDRRRRARNPAAERGGGGQSLEPLLVTDDDEAVGLGVLLPVMRPTWRMRRRAASRTGLSTKPRWFRAFHEGLGHAEDLAPS